MGQLTENREVFYLLILVYYKGYNSGTVKRKRHIGQGMGWGSLQTEASKHRDESTNSEPITWGSYGCSITQVSLTASLAAGDALAALPSQQLEG